MIIHIATCMGSGDPPPDLQPVISKPPVDSSLTVVEDKSPPSGKVLCYCLVAAT